MAAGFHHDTAKIYQFPVVDRRSSLARRPETMPSSVINFPEKAQYAVIDTCWYHQEAVDKDKNPN